MLQERNDIDYFDRRFTLMSAFEDFADAETDVVVLNSAPPLLQHQILKDGRLFYERDRAVCVEFSVHSMKIYHDLQWNNAYFARAWFESMRNAGDQAVEEAYLQMRLREHEVERLKQDRALLLGALKRARDT